MNRTLQITTVLLAAFLSPLTAWADRARIDVPEGTRIRISSRALGLRGDEGTVAVAGNRGLVVEFDRGGRTPVPFPEVDRMDICYRERGTLYGAVAGMGLGIITVFLASTDNQTFSTRYEQDSMGAILLGATVGGAIGALIGSAITFETWRPLIWYEDDPYRGRTAGIGFSSVLCTDR